MLVLLAYTDALTKTAEQNTFNHQHNTQNLTISATGNIGVQLT